jgi:hypothetical protein
VIVSPAAGIDFGPQGYFFGTDLASCDVQWIRGQLHTDGLKQDAADFDGAVVAGAQQVEQGWSG